MAPATETVTEAPVLKEILVWQLTMLEFTNLPSSFMFVPWVKKGSNKSAAPSVAPKYRACVAPTPAPSKGGEGGKGRSNKCSEPFEVACGDTFTGKVTLSSPFFRLEVRSL